MIDYRSINIKKLVHLVFIFVALLLIKLMQEFDFIYKSVCYILLMYSSPLSILLLLFCFHYQCSYTNTTLQLNLVCFYLIYLPLPIFFLYLLNFLLE